MQRMLYNNFVCIIIISAEKVRLPHIFSLFIPHDFEIIYFDVFTSIMLCHCIFLKCVQSFYH